MLLWGLHFTTCITQFLQHAAKPIFRSQQFFPSTYCHFSRQQSMLSVVLGHRHDGSAVILGRPHGNASRVGSHFFRSVFLALGTQRLPRTLVYSFLHRSDWDSFRRTNARVFLFLVFSSSTAVASLRVALPPAQQSPVVSSDESEESTES